MDNNAISEEACQVSLSGYEPGDMHCMYVCLTLSFIWQVLNTVPSLSSLPGVPSFSQPATQEGSIQVIVFKTSHVILHV